MELTTVIFYAASLLWSILIGIFLATVGIIFAASDKSRNTFSSVNLSVSSRKVEFLSLAIPTAGVVAINQIVLSSGILFGDLSESIFDCLGIQWYWIFATTDQTLISAVSIGELFGLTISSAIFLATAVGILISVSALDVIHAIAIPTLGVKLDAIPGRIALQNIFTESPGIYSGQCSELCGAMHAFMPMAVFAV